MQQAFSDGKRHFQEGLPSGPSAFLQNMSDTACDMKQKVLHPSLPHDGHNVLEHTCCSSVLLGNIQTFQVGVKTMWSPNLLCGGHDTESLIGTIYIEWHRVSHSHAQCKQFRVLASVCT